MNGHFRGGFIQRTIEGLYAVMQRALSADHAAGQRGLLQRFDPRVKVAGLFFLIVAASSAARLWVIGFILILAVALAFLSMISVRTLLTRVWLGTLAFSGAIAVPALFLTPGDAFYQLPGLHWVITAQGLKGAAYLILRTETAATLALLLVFTTPWMHVLKALRIFRVPSVFVVILSMTCRYILLMLETAHEMFESRKSRVIGHLSRGEQRRLAISTAGVLLNRSVQLSDEVYLAMQARGFRGEIHILSDFHMTKFDWLALIGFVGIAGTCIWVGR